MLMPRCSRRAEPSLYSAALGQDWLAAYANFHEYSKFESAAIDYTSFATARAGWRDD
jgi:hypothetical protein